MPTYVYETLGPSKRVFEVKQSMKDAALTTDPETGEPVRRVISGGYGLLQRAGAAERLFRPRLRRRRLRLPLAPPRFFRDWNCVPGPGFLGCERNPVTNKKAQLSIIFFTVFIDLIGFGIVIPVLPLYAKYFHATESVNGLLVGIYSGMQFFFAPVLGKISDRVGRRPVLLVSLLGTAAGFALMGFARTLTWLFVARIVDGISGGNISTAQTYIADITTPEDRSRAMGLIGAAFGLGFMFGPPIGGLLSKYSLGAPFFFASGLALRECDPGAGAAAGEPVRRSTGVRRRKRLRCGRSSGTGGICRR